MLHSDYIKGCLATVIWNDPWAKEDQMNGLLARALVIRNRSNAGWQSGNYLAILEDLPKFEGNLVPEDHRPSYGDPRNPLFGKFLWNLDLIWDGQQKDITNRALFYARLDKPLTEWFQVNVVGQPDYHRAVATVGMATFFN